MVAIDEKLKRMPRHVRVGVVAGGLSEFITIQAAIDWCNTQAVPAPSAATPYVVQIWPGVYDEVITMASWVNLKGIGPKGSVVIAQTDANIITLADNVEIQNLTVRLVTPTFGRQLILDGGVACTVRMSDLALEITTPGNLNHTLFYFTGAGDYTIERCSANIPTHTGIGRTIQNTTAAATIHFFNNDFTFNSVNASHILSTQAGTWTGGGNRWAGTCGMFNVSLGTILLDGDRVDCSGGSTITGGSVCIKNGQQEYVVWAGMLIQHAITAAAADTPTPAATAPYTVLIHPGVYDEAITCASWVNLKGIGPKGSVVIYQNDANVITLADGVEFQNFTVRLGTPTAGRQLILDSGVACTCRMSDIIFEVTTPGGQAISVVLLTAASTATIERCSHNIGGTGGSATINNWTSAVTLIHLINNDFNFNNVNAYHIISNQAGTWTGGGNRWAGTCGMFNCTNGTFTFDNDAMICTAAWTNTGTTMTLRHCAIEAPVVAGAGALVRLKDCSYRAISRAGTGNIVDESPQLQDAPWKVHKWGWMTALASMDVAVRGTPVDAGSGQVLLEVTDNVADFEAVETNPEAAGALGNEFTPARTPRFLKQISVDSFDAHVTMFFGLRATLGNAVPGAGEDHAGFDWDGTNFRAISSDGAGVGQQTNLTTPSVDAQHQLEVIVIGGVQVEFYVDGVLVATHSNAAGIPNAVMDWQHLLATAGAGAGDLIQVTVRPGGCQECPA